MPPPTAGGPPEAETTIGLSPDQMTHVPLHHLAEADELLTEVASWSDNEIQTLPKFYRERAHRYQQLRNSGDPKQL